MIQLRRNASMARGFGIEAHVIGLDEAKRRYPLLRTDDLVGAVWIPSDGKGNPADITQALATGARAGGARVLEQVRVTGVTLRDGAVAGVETAEGAIATEIVVNCAGIWARELGRMSGVTVPLHACEHMYMVTEPFPGVAPDLPVMRDPDGHIYFKEEVGGILMGGFDPWAKPWGMHGIPADFSFGTLPEDWDKFEILMKNAIQRVPALETAPVRLLMNGPESFTPDNYFILGEAPEVRRYYVGAGFCSGGIAAAGGAGQALAQWIVDDAAPMDLSARGHSPLRALSRGPDVPPRAGQRGRGRPLLHRLPQPRAHQRTRAAPLAALRSPRRQGRLLRRQDGLGARELVRARGRRAGDRLLLRTSELVPVRGRRASRRARERWPCSTRPRSASCCCRGATRSGCSSGCASTTWRLPPGRIVYTGLLNERGRLRERPHGGPTSRKTAIRSSPAPPRSRATRTGSEATSTPARGPPSPT